MVWNAHSEKKTININILVKFIDPKQKKIKMCHSINFTGKDKINFFLHHYVISATNFGIVLS